MIVEEFPEPYKSMGRDAIFFRSRSFVFLHEDELVFDAILKKHFPGWGYVGAFSKAQESAVEPPEPRQFSTLAGQPIETTQVHFDAPDACPQVMRSDQATWWHYVLRAWPNGYWHRSVKPIRHALKQHDGRMIERLYVSELVFRCRRWVKEDLRMATKALRLLDKAGTRNIECVRWPDMDDAKPYGLLHGHHAVAWLRADPDRVSDLRFSSTGAFAARPGPDSWD
jgi:hypothetical protein